MIFAPVISGYLADRRFKDSDNFERLKDNLIYCLVFGEDRVSLQTLRVLLQV